MSARITARDEQLVDSAEVYAKPGRVVIAYERRGKAAEGQPFGIYTWCPERELTRALESYNRAIHRWPLHLIRAKSGRFEITEVRNLQSLLKE